MKKLSNTILIVSVFALTFGFAFYSFAVGNAQITTKERSGRIAATPTPRATIDIHDIPPPPPVPEIDTGIIRIESELVNLNVRVVDRNNRSIGNLNQRDFKIYEDGVEQKISFFTTSEVPTNYSLVIDNSASLRKQIEKVIDAGKIIISTNKPEDETSIIRFVSREKIEILQDFTANKEDLFYYLDNMFVEGGQTAIIDAVYLAAERVDAYEKSIDPNDRKRRALILVSDGENRDSFYNETQLFQLLREADVQIFTVGFVNELDDESGFISKSPRKKAKSFLERLAEETGGKAYFPDNLGELNGIAQDIARELRTQYSIGYEPTNTGKDGSFRKIKVVVADGPKNQKRIAVTRTGRVAGNEDGPRTLQRK